jgi:3-methyladenine DNA glycosylase AlkD
VELRKKKLQAMGLSNFKNCQQLIKAKKFKIQKNINWASF